MRCATSATQAPAAMTAASTGKTRLRCAPNPPMPMSRTAAPDHSTPVAEPDVPQVCAAAVANRTVELDARDEHKHHEDAERRAESEAVEDERHKARGERGDRPADAGEDADQKGRSEVERDGRESRRAPLENRPTPWKAPARPPEPAGGCAR